MPQRLRVACWDYDRVSALRDGRARVEGAEVEFTVLSPHGFFFRAGGDVAFDVMEQSMSSYMRSRALGTNRYTAIPVYPSRMFRHSAIYVRADGPVRTPRDLIGKRVGVPYYGITAAMTARGVLQDEYGVRPGDMCWIEAPLEPGEKLPGSSNDLPSDVAIDYREHDDLVSLLLDGSIAAIVSAAWPSAYRRGGEITRLFPDTRKVEAAYFGRTGIFPIMHVIGIRNELLADDPSLAPRIYRAFCAAKALSDETLDGTGGAAMATLPWMVQEVEDTIAAMGHDFWPYGIERNRTTLDAMTRWSFEQGLTPRRLQVEELFAASTLG